MKNENDYSIEATEQRLKEIEEIYVSLVPLAKEYNYSQIKLQRIVRKPARHSPELIRKIHAAMVDLAQMHKKIQGIINAPLARTPGYHDNLKLMFSESTDQETLPEHIEVKRLQKNFRVLISGFLKHHKEEYVKSAKARKADQHSPEHPYQDNQVRPV